MKKLILFATMAPFLAMAQNTFVKQVPTGTGAPVNATSPTLVTPNLGTPTTLVLTNATGSPTGITVAQSQVTGLVTDLSNKQPLNSNLTAYAGITPSANVQTLLSAADYTAFKTSLSLGNVTNESKATMFTSPTFTGSAVLGTPASGNFSSGSFTWPTFNQSTTGSAATLTTPRAIYGNNFDGSAAVTGTIGHTYLGTGGGTGSKFLRDDGTYQTIAGGGDALTSNPLSQFAATTSAQLRGVISDEIGTGAALFDAATNPSFNNLKGTYTTTATAAGTTTLTVSSTYDNVFTGATTQDAVLPDATTLTAGMGYHFVNNSTGVVTVKKNGGTTVKAMAAGTELYVTVTDISTAAGTYISSYSTDLSIGNATATDITMAAETPSTPAADNVKLFGYKVGGRTLPGWIDPSGLDNALQPLYGRNRIQTWLPAGNSTTIVANGAAALTATGTATAANIATTNRHTQISGLEYLVTAAATTAVAGFRAPANQYFMGNSAGNGGFFFVCRFGPATGVATTTSRLFVGMTTVTTAPTDVEPSSITNMFGVGYDAADANIQFFNNDGSGTATKTSLGIAVPTADRTSVYELAMFCAPNSTTIYYTFKDLAEGGSSVSGSVSTDIPAVNTLMSPRGYSSVGGTSSVIGISLKSLYIESDY